MTKNITLPGTLDALEPMAEFLGSVSKAAALSSGVAGKLHLAVDEIVTNIIVHGYEENGLRGQVDMVATWDDRTLTIVVEDTAPAYDPRQRQQPDDLSKPLEERAMGGLGVFLAMRSVDKFDYERVGNRNRNSFLIKLPGSKA